MQHQWRALRWGPCTLTARPKDDDHLFQFHQPFLTNKETQTLGSSSLRVYWKLGSESTNLTDQHSPAARGTEWIFLHFSAATYVSEHTGATRSITPVCKGSGTHLHEHCAGGVECGRGRRRQENHLLQSTWLTLDLLQLWWVHSPRFFIKQHLISKLYTSIRLPAQLSHCKYFLYSTFITLLELVLDNSNYLL